MIELDIVSYMDITEGALSARDLEVEVGDRSVEHDIHRDLQKYTRIQIAIQIPEIQIIILISNIVDVMNT